MQDIILSLYLSEYICDRLHHSNFAPPCPGPEGQDQVPEGPRQVPEVQRLRGLRWDGFSMCVNLHRVNTK